MQSVLAFLDEQDSHKVVFSAKKELKKYLRPTCKKDVVLRKFDPSIELTFVKAVPAQEPNFTTTHAKNPEKKRHRILRTGFGWLIKSVKNYFALHQKDS